MNVIELLADLQIRQDADATRAGELREHVEHLNAALAEAEAGLAERVTTRKVIAELAPTGTESEPPELTPVEASSLNLDAATTRDGFNAALRGLEPARPPAATPA
ncbi:hypothetical protein [Streptomyces sp. NBC_00564]|uniref:hypothetical protein n=1 Tax=Streptomyces sp. NBC_00564 TaxID=2903663 RepID=UPI00352C5659|nr:hypothetical protein OG256_46610 [Streptomyces sp. NBC_00564]